MLRISTRARLALVITTFAALALPTNASAIMVGAEANGELVNSDRTPELQAIALDRMEAQGVQVLRANLSWGEVAANCGGFTAVELENNAHPCYNWAIVDSLVRLAAERKIQVLVSVSRAPGWLHGRFDQPYYLGASNTEYTRTVTFFASFMRAAGSRYRQGSPNGAIQRWTIWNEPNSNTFFKPAPNATRYAQMYGRAAVALKSGNPKALVAPGPTGPKSTIKPVPFITTFQKQVVKYIPKKGFINAWAHNPYPNGKPPTGDKRTKRSYVEKSALGMAETGALIKLLDKQKITKGVPVWATEFGWETRPEENRFMFNPVSRTVQAQYVADSFAFLASHRRVQIGIWYGLTDNRLKDDWQSGTFDYRGIAKPSHYAYQRMISTGGSSARKQQVIKLWGRSNIASKQGKLVYRTSARGAWKAVPRVKRASDGSLTASFKLTKAKTWFAVRDNVKTAATKRQPVGPARLVTAR
jgi:hypothetical protein